MQKTTSKTKSTGSTSSKSRSNGAASRSNGAASQKKTSSRSTGYEASEMQAEKLDEFMLDSLKDIYWAEKHLVKALGKLEKAATSQQLKDAFVNHAEETKEHVSRLEQVFEILGKKAQAKKCEAMEGLTKEAESIIEETEEGTLTRDVALIMAAQKVEHYEIATYGGLTQLAKTLGQTDIAELFGETLQEEKDTDQLLTDLAENDINMQAAEGTDQEDEEEEEE